MKVGRLDVGKELIDFRVRQKAGFDHPLPEPLYGHAIDLAAGVVAAAAPLERHPLELHVLKPECS